MGVTRRVGARDSPRRDVGLAGALAGDDEVLRALLRRRAAGSRADGNRIALAVSRGGMRGAYAGGMVHALSMAQESRRHAPVLSVLEDAARSGYVAVRAALARVPDGA